MDNGSTIPPEKGDGRESLSGIFIRFLRFGFLAWGGPVAQIAMIRRELVDEEQWIPSDRFGRVLAVYQALPGPEAHELCVYFGMIAHGRWGAFLAGLGFMLPGLVFMFILSWLYVSYGVTSAMMAALMAGLQPAATALIFRAIQRIGSHALHNRWLWLAAIVSAVLQWVGVHFAFSLAVAGFGYAMFSRRWTPQSPMMMVWLFLPIGLATATALAIPSQLDLFFSGLRAGLLTFGGAYTVIPFLQHDAVVVGGWMTDAQFLDGLAISGTLPAPLIIFGTFVGYLGGGPYGSLVLTAGLFLPSFAFTIIGHSFFERLVENRSLHAFLDGVTAGVVGLITVVAIRLLETAVTGPLSVVIFVGALVVLFRWKAKIAVAVVMVASALLGYILAGF